MSLDSRTVCHCDGPNCETSATVHTEHPDCLVKEELSKLGWVRSALYDHTPTGISRSRQLHFHSWMCRSNWFAAESGRNMEDLVKVPIS